MKQVGKFTEQEAWKLIRDVASGLAWLHGMNPPVIHQDIKPDNIMIGEKGDFMITDFGVSSHLKSTLRKSLSSAFSSAGTIAYMAPERFGKDNTPIMANDIYSLGATAFEMLAGDTPFGDDGGLVQKKGAEVPELQGDFSVQLKKVIAKCLRTNPWERPTAEQLEIYASAGMRGETIRFIDEKTFFQKHKIVIILAVVLGFASFVVGGVMLNNHRENERELRRVMAEKQYNDSLSFCIQRYLVTADSLKEIGDQHYENYEIAYLAAFENYKRAQDCTFKFIGDSVSVDEKKWEGMKSVENELYAAYKTFNEKANFFAEEKEIADDFKMRADKISTVIDIESVGKVLSDTVKTEN